MPTSAGSRWRASRASRAGATARPRSATPARSRPVGTAAYVFPQVRRAILDARARAGIAPDVSGIDAVETRLTRFTATEYMAIDHLGLTAPGESWKAVENGDIAIGGRLPINPSGGLIGTGYPVGAHRRADVAWTRGNRRPAGPATTRSRARTVQTLNIGGSATTTVSFVVAGRRDGVFSSS
ncbi:thiolase C-terminal domain-containing protein [Caulobacter segnis]